MHLSQRTLLVAAAAIAMAASPAVAGARSYTGNWPVTVSNSQRSNGTYCLMLNGGNNGGSASLVMDGQKYPYGSFLVINDIILVTIQEPLYGQNGALLFTAHANRGHIGNGLFENAEGGSNFDSGSLMFGMKGGC